MCSSVLRIALAIPKKAVVITGLLVLPLVGTDSAKAQTPADEAVRSLIQSISQTIRDEVRRRLLHTAPFSRPLRYSGDDVSSATPSIYDDAFGALGYSSADLQARAASPIVTKAAPIGAQQNLIYNTFFSAGHDWSFASGVETNTLSIAGGGTVTKIGFFSATDAITVGVIGSGAFSRVRTLKSDTSVPGVTGLLNWQNGNFSSENKVTGSWSETETAGLKAKSDSVSFASDYNYRFDLGNTWYVEPTVGHVYTKTFFDGFSAEGKYWEVHGGGRIGTSWVSNGMSVSPSTTLIAYSPVSTEVGGAGGSASSPLEGKVGFRGSSKIDFGLSSSFTATIEGRYTTIDHTHGYGVQGTAMFRF